MRRMWDRRPDKNAEDNKIMTIQPTEIAKAYASPYANFAFFPPYAPSKEALGAKATVLRQ